MSHLTIRRSAMSWAALGGVLLAASLVGCTGEDSDADGGGGGGGTTSTGGTSGQLSSGGTSSGDGGSGQEVGGSGGSTAVGGTNGSGGGVSTQLCGNGESDPGESCDDGDVVAGDGCTNLCSLEGHVIQCNEQEANACGDGADNDGDGLVDADDPNCVSPCDDTEDEYGNGTDPFGTCIQDCFFDGNAGAADDECSFDLRCDPNSPGAEISCAYDSGASDCSTEVNQECPDRCLPAVPNGCDCFGCCSFGENNYYLGSGNGCSADNLEACQPCSLNSNCFNECDNDACELCIGQSWEDLPSKCEGTPSCSEGVTQCHSVTDCESGEFCQMGCCTPAGLSL